MQVTIVYRSAGHPWSTHLTSAMVKIPCLDAPARLTSPARSDLHPHSLHLFLHAAHSRNAYKIVRTSKHRLMGQGAQSARAYNLSVHASSHVREAVVSGALLTRKINLTSPSPSSLIQLISLLPLTFSSAQGRLIFVINLRQWQNDEDAPST